MAPSSSSSSSSDNDISAALQALFQYDNISLHHVPNQLAPAALSSMLVFTFCLGIITLELIANAVHDVRLLLRQGWREPRKAVNRISYFACRYGAFFFLLAVVLYTNLPAGQHCRAFAQALNVLWVLPLVFVDLIFVQRTLAVYGWQMRVLVPLVTLYLAYIALCTYTVVQFGYGYSIPGSQFCSYQTTSEHNKAHRIVFILYIVTTVAMDSAILLLTADRVLEGGLRNIGHLLCTDNEVLHRDKAARKAAGHIVGEVSLSGMLLRQGLLYFAILWISRVAFLVVYYALPADTYLYQILISGILATVGPVLAGMLFRQTSEAVKRTNFARNAALAAEGQVSFRSSGGFNAMSISEAAYTSSSPATRHRGSSNSPLPSPLFKTSASGRPMTTLEMLQANGLAGSLSPSPLSGGMSGLTATNDDAPSDKERSEDIEAALSGGGTDARDDTVSLAAAYFEEEEDRVDNGLHVFVHDKSRTVAAAAAAAVDDDDARKSGSSAVRP